jgi:hypothetical protein
MIAAFGFESGGSVSIQKRWILAMLAHLTVFLTLSSMMGQFPMRLIMYCFGATTVFCAAIYFTYNAVDLSTLDAYNGGCGNLRLFPDMGRLACLSIFLGVPLLSVAGMIGPKILECRLGDEQHDAPKPSVGPVDLR